MKIAVYSRKSKTTDSGESIENQISICKDYILKWSSVDKNDIEFIIYRDEGFTGGNTNRPEFQRMINDAKKNTFGMLVCYRLDRVSRDVADFANTYELLNDYAIEFVSVKEQFDTSTPIGRAMLNLAMVFAQLERETIAERIRDNMLGLARTGRWLGGITPTGFTSEPIEYFDYKMTSKRMYKLAENVDEMKKVKVIFNKFMTLKSLRSTESYLLINNILSKNECKYTADTIKDILINPVYAAADETIYDYFSSLGCEICNTEEEFDGTRGLMVYNKTDQSKKIPTQRDCKDWIVAIGHHSPIVDGLTWTIVQQTLDSNTEKSFYTKDGMQYGILTNLIKCKHCSSTMKIKKGKISASGDLSYTYVCATKEMSRRTHCNIKNIIGQEVDKDVVDYLISLSHDESFMISILSANNLTITTELQESAAKVTHLQNKLSENEKSIDNLMGQLAKLPPNEAIVKRYMHQLRELDNENVKTKQTIEDLKSERHHQEHINLNLEFVRKALLDLSMLKDSNDIHLQRSLVRTVVDKIIWDGEELNIQLFGQDKVADTHLCSDSKCYTYSRGCHPVCYAK